MKKDPSNTWLFENKKLIDNYVSLIDIMLIERKRTTKLLLDLFQYCFEDRTGLRVIDLGCGDGSMILDFSRRYPNNKYYLMDGSAEMLSKAKATLDGDNFNFVLQTFEDYISSEGKPSKYDMVFSSNAIHHLTLTNKSKMYTRIFHELANGGLFINMDVVLPPSERIENWEFRMWIDWINETLDRNNLNDLIGKYDGIPKIYKDKPENKPDGLSTQLGLLRDIGFKDVECFYKYGIFTMFGGIK